jgi:putative signal transducing protein
MAADPTPAPNPNEKLVRVFDTEQEAEAMVVHGLLESAGIDSEITGLENSQDVLPLGGTLILVRAEDAERARQLIEEYRRSPEEETAEENNFDESPMESEGAVSEKKPAEE